MIRTSGANGASGADLFSPSSSVFSDFSASDYSCMHRSVALRVRIFSRLTGLRKHFFKFYTGDFDRFTSLEHECVRLLALCTQLDKYSVISNSDLSMRVYREVRLAFQAYPLTLKDHCIYLFGQFTDVKPPRNAAVLRAEATLAKARSSGASSSFVALSERNLLDVSVRFNFYQAIFSKLLKASLFGRKSELVRRLNLEAEDLLVERKWFCVFNTLTLTQSQYIACFSKGSTMWRSYIRNVDSCFARASFGSVRAGQAARRAGDDFHRYFAVTERGGKHGRLHIHVLHFFRDLPDSFRDPNLGSRQPFNRQIEAMWSFWSKGFSTPIAVRFHQGDAFGRRGWIWPVNDGKKKRVPYLQPIQAKPPCALVNYVAKYLNKAYTLGDRKLESSKEIGCIWRSRLSRKMGQGPVVKLVSQLSVQEQDQLIRHPVRVVVQGRTFPRRLLRRHLLRLMYLRLRTLNPSLLRSAILRWFPKPPIWTLVVDSIRRIGRFSQRKCGVIPMNISRSLGDFRLFSESFSFGYIEGFSYAVR